MKTLLAKLSGCGVAALLMSGTTALADNCEYHNFTTDEYVRGKCTSTWSSEQATETYKFKGKTVKIKELARQGVWARVLIDGKPGTRIEHDRTSFDYSTDDLKVTFGHAR